mgnify:CR=1 FL=1
MSYIVKPDFFDYNTNLKLFEEITVNFPFLKPRLEGRTALGRGIFSLSLGNEQNSVLIAGGFHGSEWITCLAIYLFTERLCRHLSEGTLLCGVDIEKAFSKLGVTLIPCVNPDGTEIAVHGAEGAKGLRSYVASIGCENYCKWNANALGVDINHNFNAGWDKLRQMEREEGIYSPSPTRYGGRFAESEAETRTLTRLCRMKNFRSVMALHSQGEELFWKYGERTPKASAMMAKIIADSCGYRLTDNSGLFSHGGFKDWFIEEFGLPGFTMEIGKGENPLPVEMLCEIYDRIEEALLLFCLM